ncbi:MAG: A24 family peptidase [Planctomycetes bacterium]|nr:A24 family peptidase [Planctomycetota bacterium]
MEARFSSHLSQKSSGNHFAEYTHIQPQQPPASEAPVSTPALPAPETDDSLGLDREFAIKMARMPLFALLWVAAAALSHQIWAALSLAELNAGPLIVLSFGMILAAFIDGWALKVPNWVTLPLILSGWLLGLLHNVDLHPDSGTGGIGNSVLCTVIGFFLLFPMLAIRGVGEGDVKMQMGFGAWVGAYFGWGDTTAGAGFANLTGPEVTFWGFAYGAIVGGAFGLIIIFIRRQWNANASMYREIGKDLTMFAQGETGEAMKRAEERRKVWVKLPYGIPLCVGFLLFLGFKLILQG